LRTTRLAAAIAGVIAMIGAFVTGPASASPLASTPQGEVDTVSCGGPSTCLAWGVRNGALETLVWSGGRWTAPTTNQGGGALSCLGKTWCMSVGDATKPERARSGIWNGKTWRFVFPAAIAGQTTLLGGVSCTTRTTCVAVGAKENKKTLVDTTYTVLWNGTSWKLVPSPNIGKNASLSAVSCWTANGCLAVGHNNNIGFAEVWNGSNWTLDRPPAALTLPEDESCGAPSDCWVTGIGNGFIPYAAHWNGTGWTLHRFGSNIFELDGVTCRASNDCWAVGENANRNGNPASEHWNGTSWTVVPMPAPKNADTETILIGVSCMSDSACVAVGRVTVNFDTPRATEHQFAEAWNGARWRITPLP